MPRRLITSQIFLNEKFGNLNDAGRLFFIGCFTNADDDGRLKASPKYLKALIFPYDDDKSADLIRELRDHCHELGLIFVYNQNGSEYLYCIGWEGHQMIRKDRYHPSTLPPPNTLMPTTLQPSDNQMATSDQPNIIESNIIESNINNKVAIIFKVFEDNFQQITAATTNCINAYITQYGADNVLTALNSAIKQNKRNLAYVEGILEQRGKRNGTHKSGIGKVPTKYTPDEDLYTD